MDGHRSKYSWNSGLFGLLLFGSILFAGCLTQKKREDITHRYLRENPKTLADLASIHFPVVPRPGVPAIVRDTVVSHNVDTVYADSIRIVRVETLKEITNNIHTTDTVPDGALANALMEARFLEERAKIRAEADRDHQTERAQMLWRWVLGLGGAVVIGLGIGGFTLYRRLLT